MWTITVTAATLVAAVSSVELDKYLLFGTLLKQIEANFIVAVADVANSMGRWPFPVQLGAPRGGGFTGV